MAKVFWVIVFLFAGMISLEAEDIIGADDPDFIQAKETWLDGHDLSALHSLAKLARDGNISAKILLSRIADAPKVSAHISNQLSRKERIALFREPKGLSGRDWLVSAGEENDLAYALWVIQSSSLKQPDFKTIIPVLITHGETRPIFGYLHKMWLHGQHDYAVQILYEHSELFGAAGRDFLGFHLQTMAVNGSPLPLPHSIDTREKAETFLRDLRSEVNRFASSGSIEASSNRIAVPHNLKDRTRMVELIRKLPELEPLTVFCQRTCKPNYQDSCLANSAWALMQIAEYPYPFASPAQSLIDDATYQSSPRFPLDITRTLKRGKWSGCR